MRVDFKHFEIELKDDPSYRIKSTGTPIYAYEFSQGAVIKNLIFTINKRAIIVRDATSKQEISSAILCENGGKAELTQDSFKLEEGQLWICAGDKMYSLDIPSLQVKWFINIDFGTIHSINFFGGDLIIHSNMGLVRINKKGETIWKFSEGNGVFIPGEGRLKLFEKHIELIDGNDQQYRINEFGESISKTDAAG